MAHYAFLDENNVVTEVIVGWDEGHDGVDWEEFYAAERGLPPHRCKRTSYNTKNGTRSDGGVPYRGNYASIGCTYDPVSDVFVVPPPGEEEPSPG